jgi:hypothetical protein
MTILTLPTTVDADPYAACPPWCARDRFWHENPEFVVHEGPYVVVPTEANEDPCTRHSDIPGIDPATVSLCLERDDEGGQVGEPRLWLSTDAEPAHLSLNRAEALAHQILARVAEARAALQPAGPLAAAHAA